MRCGGNLSQHSLRLNELDGLVLGIVGQVRTPGIKQNKMESIEQKQQKNQGQAEKNRPRLAQVQLFRKGMDSLLRQLTKTMQNPKDSTEANLKPQCGHSHPYWFSRFQVFYHQYQLMIQIGSNAFDKIKGQEILKAAPCYGLNGWSADEQTTDNKPLLGSNLLCPPDSQVAGLSNRALLN